MTMNTRIAHEDGNLSFGEKIRMTDDLTPIVELIASIRGPILFFNVGSARVMGDALGPLIGTMLEEAKVAKRDVAVMGTAADQIHANTISRKIACAKTQYTHHTCIAIDAMVGKVVGTIHLERGMLNAGAATKRMLESIGDWALTVCTNDSPKAVLEGMYINTNIGFIYSLARRISTAIIEGLRQRRKAKRRVPVVVRRV